MTVVGWVHACCNGWMSFRSGLKFPIVAKVKQGQERIYGYSQKVHDELRQITFNTDRENVTMMKLAAMCLLELMYLNSTTAETELFKRIVFAARSARNNSGQLCAWSPR